MRAKPRGKRAGWLGCMIVLLASALAMAGSLGCGRNVSSITRNYTLTVTATSGALSHSTTATLTVE